MKTEKNIFVVFVLNLVFAVFEFFGGMVTGSVAILSDAVHDFGDAVCVGVAYFLEKKSKNKPDATHTYGYIRYSVVGSVITTLILLLGSVAVIYKAIQRIMEPADIHYNGMILFAVAGVCINLCAAYFTREGDSLNQKAVNLHMLEDVLGWVVVLVGAVVMRFTDFVLIDPILSIGVAVYIFVNAIQHLREALDLFLEKTPRNVDVQEILEHVLQIRGVLDVHHIHLWSLDGHTHCATMHVVTDDDPHRVKAQIRRELQAHGVGHVTLELETEGEPCDAKYCGLELTEHTGYHQHHHHHHHP